MKKVFAGLIVTIFAIAQTAPAQTEIKIQRDAPVGTIRPEIYGQFVEHLGTQIYDGLWVGPDSSIPNTGGIRNDVFAALKELHVPVLRWPGGCFADQYHWREGIGPADKRVPRVNISWGGTPEPNQFGTHEFFNLAERLGAKTYLDVNLGTGTVREAADWLEYVTFDTDSALTRERRTNGRTKPWRIDYLSIGNETWGCGGHMRPQTYADLYVQYATFLKTAGEQPIHVLSGSNEGNVSYSDALLDHPEMGSLADAVSVHYYTLPTGDWKTKGSSTDFGEAQWASTIQQTLRMEDVITRMLAMIDHHKLPKSFGLVPDEWGVWTDTLKGAPGALYQQNSIRDAVVAAINLNLFNAHADRIPMTNIAQMVNVLQAMILTDGPRMLRTPTYHVYAMFRPFQGATSLPVTISGGPKYSFGNTSFPALSASAAQTTDGAYIVAITNADANTAHWVTLDAGSAKHVRAQVLTGGSIDAHNTFDAPDVVVPRALEVSVAKGRITVNLPQRSVSVLRFE